MALQIRDLILTAPAQLREDLGALNTKARVARCARFRLGGDPAEPLKGTKLALRTLARRYESLSEEMQELDETLDHLTARANPALRGAKGVGVDVAAILLVAAGDNPERLRNESAFAAMCGVNPIEASSGKIVRHRLNRSGNRQANHALWRIATNRMVYDDATKTYAARRRAEGKTQRDVVRCLKRYVAREIYRLLVDPPPVISAAGLGLGARHSASPSTRPPLPWGSPTWTSLDSSGERPTAPSWRSATKSGYPLSLRENFIRRLDKHRSIKPPF